MFTSCANSQQEQQAAPTPTKQTNTPQKDIRKNRSNYSVSTARSEKDIKKEFPYDIALKTADGKQTNSATALKSDGKPTVVLFWLTTCYPCRIEMDAINKVYAEWTANLDFNMVAISTDFGKNFGKFAERVKAKNFPWEMYHDMNREFRYVMPGNLNGLPQTFIMDAEGNIVYHKRKFSSGDEQKLYAALAKVAKKK